MKLSNYFLESSLWIFFLFVPFSGEHQEMSTEDISETEVIIVEAELKLKINENNRIKSDLEYKEILIKQKLDTLKNNIENE